MKKWLFLFSFFLSLTGCDEKEIIKNVYKCTPAKVRCEGADKLICNVDRAISTGITLIYDWQPYGNCEKEMQLDADIKYESNN